MEHQPEPETTRQRRVVPRQVRDVNIALVLPNVVGLPANQALAVLRACLLTSQNHASITLDNKPVDLSSITDTHTIATQSPAYTGLPASPTTIALTTTQLEAMTGDVYMPNLVGLTPPAAFAAADALGAICAATHSGMRFEIQVTLEAHGDLTPPYPAQFAISSTVPPYDPDTPIDPGGIVAVVVFDPFPEG